MLSSYYLIKYDPLQYDGDIFEGNVIKISLRIHTSDQKVCIEHIWTIVENFDGKFIEARIDNHLVCKPKHGAEDLEYGKIIKYKRAHIKEIKHYDDTTKQEAIRKVETFIQNLPMTIRVYLGTLPTDKRNRVLQHLYCKYS